MKLNRYSLADTTTNVTFHLFVLTDNLFKLFHCLDIQFSEQSYTTKTRIKPFLLLLIKHAHRLIYTHSKAFCVTVASKEKKGQKEVRMEKNLANAVNFQEN